MRQLPLYVLTVLVVLGLIYAFVAPFNGAVDTPSQSQGVDVTLENFELPDEMTDAAPKDTSETAQPQGRVTSQARQVDPDAVAPSGTDNAPLERVEPRPPLSTRQELLPAPPTAPAPAPPPTPVDNTAKPVLLYRPIATAAGTIEAAGYRIALDGIEIVQPEETCNVDGGSAWPCGMAARTAFRNWLRSRAVECNVPGQPPDDVIATQCRLGNADIAEWLVQNGWARAKDGTQMADRMKKAEEARLGIFGRPPAALPASTNLPIPPVSDTREPSAEPLPAPSPLAVPNAPFPPRPE
ncbi:thermonuclease family protein [Phyllobacterium zundukense]|jgi:endonuclease YncB( thermonuclease family)|uniref:Thermonuclease family protein n=1 Tax=Phyllobacterium zundukense TaxID=1867719 RepID=A0ACD4D5X4_9HYPH|nr:thermonuclease family protein [Phyllobacterium zundukense]UXN61260.1 thermonuclease family protein [Phyllobacterium zundukense]